MNSKTIEFNEELVKKIIVNLMIQTPGVVNQDFYDIDIDHNNQTITVKISLLGYINPKTICEQVQEMIIYHLEQQTDRRGIKVNIILNDVGLKG